MKSFENKVVIVTGGAHGIGASIVSEFEKEGAQVACIGIRDNALPLMKACQMIYHNDCGWSYKG